MTSDGTPTAFRPVGYPAFLSVVYMVFGHSWLAGYIVNTILSAVAVPLTYRLAREFLTGQLSLVAAGVVALLPSHISYTAFMSTESLYAVLVLVTLIATCHLVRYPIWKNAALLGLIIGIGVYVRPLLILFPVVVGLIILAHSRTWKVRSTIGLVCLTMAVSLATILPWTVRNYLVMGEPILIPTNGGYNFYEGNGPGATGEQRSVWEVFPNFTELDWHQEGYRLALEYMMNHPAEWLSVLPKKFFHLWASDWSGVAYSTMSRGYPRDLVTPLMMVAQLYWFAILLIATISTFTKPIVSYWLRFPAVLIPLTLAYWTAFHLMFHGEGRYHMQAIPLIVIVGVHLLAHDRDWKAWLPSK